MLASRSAATGHDLLRHYDLAGARPLFERALAIGEKALGAEHPDTATGLHNLASLLQAQGDLAGARPLYERALAIYEKVLGPVHPVTATRLSHLATVLKDQGNLAGARPLRERALAIREKMLGAEHLSCPPCGHPIEMSPHIGDLLHELGVVGIEIDAGRPLRPETRPETVSENSPVSLRPQAS